ncbi:hypothetical protein [Peribacillus kribbensis]|uniref:hypothetical protein n=1 Tax=Peribacillus kribbensis TaxID=356658 RepID=UPI000410A26E|nr:hypothetical protein [Peribacillus kribbensis]
MENSSKRISEEKDMHQTIKPQHAINSMELERTPFNDGSKHVDIVNGFQAPKKIEQIPKWYQKSFKIITILFLIGFILIMLFQGIQPFL